MAQNYVAAYEKLIAQSAAPTRQPKLHVVRTPELVAEPELVAAE